MISPLRVWRAGMKAIRSERYVIGSIVRPHDVMMEGRYVRQPYQELTARYLKLTKVAVSRNAVGIASVPLRVLRRTGGKKSAWESRSLTGTHLKALRASADPIARKYLEYGEDVEEITDPLHPLVKLLNTPNPWQSGFEFLEQTQTGIGLTGNAYWAVIEDAGGLQLWNLAPQYVEVLPNKETLVGGYRFGRGTEIERVFEPDDVLHFKQINPNDPYYGAGDVASCLDDSDLHLKFPKVANALLDNGAQPGLIVAALGATDEQARVIEEKVNRKHSGFWRWFRTVVLRGDYKFEKLEISKGAVEFLMGPMEAVREVIAACHDMPVELLTIKPGGLSASSDAMRQWQYHGLLPRCQRIASRINAELVPRFVGEQAGDMFVAFDNPVTEDEQVKTTNEVAKRGARITTLNEARAAFKLPPVPEGDDMEPSQEQLAIDQREADSERAAAGERDRVAKSASRVVIDYARLPVPDNGWALVQTNGAGNGHTRLDPPARKEVRATALWSKERADTEGAVEAAMKRVYERIIATVNGHMNDGSVANPLEGLDFGKLITDELGGILARDFERGWETGRNMADAPGVSPFSVQNQRAQQFLREYTLKLANSIHASVEAKIRGVVGEGMEAGDSVQGMANRVNEVLKGETGFKAEQIARSETARAFSAGQQASWSGVDTIKGVEWLKSTSPCPVCEGIHAKGVVPKGTPFWSMGETLLGSDGQVYVNDYAPVLGPPAHPNCSCGIAPVFSTEDSGTTV